MLSPENIAASVTAVAVTMAQGKEHEDIELLSAIFTQLGDTLATIAVARSNTNSN